MSAFKESDLPPAMRAMLPPRPNRRAAHRAGEMNKTECAYAAGLEARRLAGEIAAWFFECVKLRLATRTFYTPDFVVVNLDGSIDVVEVKGHWEDDARVKIKVAADKYRQFRFSAVRPVPGGGWQTEEIR